MRQNKTLIFVVDDDRYTLKRARRALQNAIDCNVSTFISGEECLQHMDDQPDVIVLDYYMNGLRPDAMNGIEALKKIRKVSKDAKVIMLSAQDKIEVAVDSIKHGAYEYISKSETAFVRLENSLKNIIQSLSLKKQNSKYEKWNYWLAAFFLLIVLVDLIAYYSLRG